MKSENRYMLFFLIDLAFFFIFLGFLYATIELIMFGTDSQFYQSGRYDYGYFLAASIILTIFTAVLSFIFFHISIKEESKL